MVHERLIVIFGDDAHLGDAGITHIGQNKVDLPVASARGSDATVL